MANILKKGKTWVKLAVDLRTYTLSTVYAAGYVFLDRAYIYLDKESKEKVGVWLFPKKKTENLHTLGLDFCNELINYSHYFDSLKVNAEVIKTLMQKALFSAAPSLVKEAAKKEVDDLIEDLKKAEEAEEQKKK